jgi:hypothetical protein
MCFSYFYHQTFRFTARNGIVSWTWGSWDSNGKETFFATCWEKNCPSAKKGHWRARTWHRFFRSDYGYMKKGKTDFNRNCGLLYYRSTMIYPKHPKTFMSLVFVPSPWYKLTQRVARHAVPGRGSDSDHAAKFIQSVHRQGQTNKSSPKKTKNNYNIVTISYDMLRKLCSLWFVFGVSHIWITIRPRKGRCHISVRTQNLVHQQCVHESSFLDWLQHASTCIFEWIISGFCISNHAAWKCLKQHETALNFESRVFMSAEGNPKASTSLHRPKKKRAKWDMLRTHWEDRKHLSVL